MSKVTEYTTDQWLAGPTTPGARHFYNYTNGLTTGAFKSTSQDAFYAQRAIFHNTNGATYRGADQIQPWMREVFSPFSKVSHLFEHAREVDKGNGTYALDARAVRQLWLKGTGPAEGREPDMNVPTAVSLIIGADPDIEGAVPEMERLRILEMWLYWDTGMLVGSVPESATLFKKWNIFDDAK